MVGLGSNNNYFLEIKWKVALQSPPDQATPLLFLMGMTGLFTGHAEDIAV